jgi:hypothetical protein
MEIVLCIRPAALWGEHCGTHRLYFLVSGAFTPFTALMKLHHWVIHT